MGYLTCYYNILNTNKLLVPFFDCTDNLMIIFFHAFLLPSPTEDKKEVCFVVWPDGPQGYSTMDF